MTELSLEALVALLLLCACSGVLHGAIGLGFPVVLTPVLALFFDVRTAVLLTLVPTASVNIVSILNGGGWWARVRQFWPLAACGVLGSVLPDSGDPFLDGLVYCQNQG